MDKDDWVAFDKEMALSVSWKDLAGNQADLEFPVAARFDFVRPSADDCMLVPEVANADSLIRYQVTASEILQQAPDLTISSINAGFFSANPVVTGQGHTYTWEQPAKNLLQETWTVSATLTDEAGNVSEGVVCELSGSVDGIAPQITDGSVHTIPEVVNGDGTVVLVVGDGDVLRVELVVSDDVKLSAEAPEVSLTIPGAPLFFELVDEEGAEEWGGYAFELSLDKELHAEFDGVWPVRVALLDAAGNLTVDDLFKGTFVHLDFTPPTALCKLNKLVGKLGDTISITVEPSEPLLPGTLTFGGSIPFLGPEQGTDIVFTHEVTEADAAVVDWNYELQVFDLAGNSADTGIACTGDGLIDAVPPQVSSSVLSTEPEVVNGVGQTILAAGPGDKVLVTLFIDESQGLASESPAVFLDVPGSPIALEKLSQEDISDFQVSAQFVLAMDPIAHADAEGYWPIRIVLEDTAGNQTQVPALQDKLVAVDFTAPQAKCTLVPATSTVPAGIGAELLVQISPLEELSTEVQPSLMESFEPNLMDPYFTFVEESSYQFSATVTQDDGERSFTLATRLTDLVGNSTVEDGNACLDGLLTGSIDGTTPGIVQVVLEPADQAPLRIGEIIQVTVTVANTELMPEVKVADRPLAAQSETPELVDNGAKWVFERTLDGTEGEGARTVTVSGQDLAGNSFLHSHEAEKFEFDFTPPIVKCLVNMDPAKAGDSLRVTVTSSEPLADPGPQVALDKESVEFEYAEALSSPDASAPKWIYEFVVPQDFEATAWTMTVTGTDVAGNPDGASPLCVAQGVADGTGIAITAWDVQASFEDLDNPGEWIVTDKLAKHGSRVGIEFSLGELPPDDSVQLLVGDDVLAPGEPVGLDYKVEFDINAPDETGQEVVPVSLTVVDVAGNITQQTLAMLTVDYDPPVLSGIPFFERTDGYAPAVVSQNDIWAGQDTDIVVSFGINEPAGSKPSVTTPGGTFQPEVFEADSNFFTVTVDDSPQEDGEVTVSASVRDLAGNQSDLELGKIRYDYDKPVGLDDEGQLAVRYLRVPWGAESTEYQPLSELRSCPAPQDESKGWNWCPEDGEGLEADVSLRVVQADSGEDGWVCTGNVVGSGRTATVNGNAAVTIAGDWPGLCVQERDRAGNEGSPVVVENVSWVATLGGDSQSNPHDFIWVERTTDSCYQNPDYIATTSLAERVELSIADDDGIPGVQLKRRWHKRSPPAQNPAGRTHPALVWDSLRGKVVMFGGNDEGADFNSETWQWDGYLWQKAPAIGAIPTGRYQHATAYADAWGATVLFGGSTSGIDYLGDCWEWDGSQWYQYEPTAEHPFPSPRHSQVMAYDRKRGRVVMYGGFSNTVEGSLLGDTWEWDGEKWEQIEPAGDPPPPRFLSAMVYDEARECMVLFSGGIPGSDLADTWTWDGQTWENVTPEGENPEVRTNHAMAYDRKRHKVVLFGGGSKVSNALSDTWEWDGEKWEKTDNSWYYYPRYWHGMAWDAHREAVILFGGRYWDGGFYGDTWEWNGERWKHISPEDAEPDRPQGRRYIQAAFDEAYGETVVMGGWDGSEQNNDTWVWNGQYWDEPTNPHWNPDVWPCLRQNYAITYDRAKHRVVLFGGYKNGGYPQNDTWVWDGFEWTKLYPNPPLPSARHRHSMVFDTSFQHPVSWGGGNEEFGQMLDYDGIAWVSIDQGNDIPVKRTAHGLTYDEARHRMVLFGGENGDGMRNDTWEWDGQQWIEMSPPGVLPEPRSYTRLAYDSSRGRTIMFGGTLGNQHYMNDLWEWDGESWKEISPELGNPHVRWAHALTYDRHRNVVVLFGGDGGSNHFMNDTWEFDTSVNYRPGAVLEIDWWESQVDEGVIEMVTPRFISGARGYTTDLEVQHDADTIGEPVDGVELQVWNARAGQWVAVANSNPELVESNEDNYPLEVVTKKIGVDDGARQLVSQSEGKIYFRVVSSAANGNGSESAELSLDYAEIEVIYRLSSSVDP